MGGALFAEKNGDTDMHKARMGLGLDNGVGVLLLSNLGGHVGGSLTALKFGMLAVAAGSTDEEADEFMSAVMNTTNIWQAMFSADATCTACGTVLSTSGPCVPG